MKLEDAITRARKIVVKIGSNSLTTGQGTFDVASIKRYAEQISSLIVQGKQIVLVSSGAVTAGASVTNNWVRKRDITYRQALSSIGQVELFNQWRQAFAANNKLIAQLLLTKEDFQDSRRNLNVRNTLFTLLDEGVVPIINENDTVTYDEIAIGDNDNLSAESAILWNADLLILLSDVDGIYTADPKANPDAEHIEVVQDIDELPSRITIGTTNEFGTGGIQTKLEAAAKTVRYGIEVALCKELGGKSTIFTTEIGRGKE